MCVFTKFKRTQCAGSAYPWQMAWITAAAKVGAEAQMGCVAGFHKRAVSTFVQNCSYESGRQLSVRITKRLLKGIRMTSEEGITLKSSVVWFFF